MIDLTAQYLRSRASYDVETGLMAWLPRRASEFKNLRCFEVWNAKYLGKPALISLHVGGYLYGSVDGKKLLAHRAAWCIHYGDWPNGQIDHIDGNPSNNAIANLRVVTNQENGRNQKTNRRNTSGAMGVSWVGSLGKWVARIGKGSAHIGCFSTFEDALAARKQAEIDLGYHPNHGARK